MTDFDALQEFLTKYHQGMDEFMRGSCEGVKPLFSQTDDATLGNPFGPVAKGMGSRRGRDAACCTELPRRSVRRIRQHLYGRYVGPNSHAQEGQRLDVTVE